MRHRVTFLKMNVADGTPAELCEDAVLVTRDKSASARVVQGYNATQALPPTQDPLKEVKTHAE